MSKITIKIPDCLDDNLFDCFLPATRAFFIFKSEETRYSTLWRLQAQLPEKYPFYAHGVPFLFRETIDLGKGFSGKLGAIPPNEECLVVIYDAECLLKDAGRLSSLAGFLGNHPSASLFVFGDEDGGLPDKLGMKTFRCDALSVVEAGRVWGGLLWPYQKLCSMLARPIPPVTNKPVEPTPMYYSTLLWIARKAPFKDLLDACIRFPGRFLSYLHLVWMELGGDEWASSRLSKALPSAKLSPAFLALLDRKSPEGLDFLEKEMLGHPQFLDAITPDEFKALVPDGWRKHEAYSFYINPNRDARRVFDDILARGVLPQSGRGDSISRNTSSGHGVHSLPPEP